MSDAQQELNRCYAEIRMLKDKLQYEKAACNMWRAVAINLGALPNTESYFKKDAG
jgi:hypothetical protein